MGRSITIPPSMSADAAEQPRIELSDEERVRYSRHLLMPEVGLEGQLRLKRAGVLLIGAGGLGSPAALYLAAAGVGRIGIVDSDAVELSNLHRQILHATGDLGRPKTHSAQERLAAINPNVTVELHTVRLDPRNAAEIISAYDVVLDGSDNFPTRYLVNDACALLGRPCVFGSASRLEGQVSLFDARSGPCYRCVHPSPPPPDLVPSCSESGVLGVVPGIIGSLQALEAIKLILGLGDGLLGRMLLFDAGALTFTEMRVQKNPACRSCGAAVIDLAAVDDVCRPVSEASEREAEISPAELRRKLNRIVLVDVREPHERQINTIGGTLIPLRELAERLHELDPRKETVVYCRTGRRSAGAVALLRGAGFTNVRHLAGGINRWIEEIDPAMPRY